MSVKIQTVIKNNGRGSRSIVIARGKICNLRAGETKVLDYDIWSYLSKVAKRKLEQDANRGVLTIATRVYTETNNLTVSPDGSFLVQNGGTADMEASDNVVKEKPKLPNPKQNVDIDSKSTTKIANKSESIMTGKLGFTTEPLGETKTEPVKMPKQGFAAETVATSGLFKREATDAAPAKTVNVMKQEPKVEQEQKKAEENPEEQMAETEPESQDIAADAMTREEYINELYAAKDYAAIAGALSDWHPKFNFSKASIKKCSSYAELKEKYPVLI